MLTNLRTLWVHLSFLLSCEKIDPVKECCDQVCQGSISDAATRLALKASNPLSMDGPHVLPEHSTSVNDCKTVVLWWLASKLDPYRAKEILRGLTNCNVNKAVRIPALPAATNAESGLYHQYVAVYLLVASSMAMMMLLQF